MHFFRWQGVGVTDGVEVVVAVGEATTAVKKAAEGMVQV